MVSQRNIYLYVRLRTAKILYLLSNSKTCVHYLMQTVCNWNGNKNTNMKGLLVCLIILVASVEAWSQEEVNLIPLSRYISKNFSLPQSLKLDCDYNYVAMVLESDSGGKITAVRYLNNADPYLKASLDHVKNFRFNASMKVEGRPILLFIDIYQQDDERCRVMDPYIMTPSKLTQEVVAILKEQLERDPRTIMKGVVRFGARASW